MSDNVSSSPLPRWELAAETIAVKIRWFGLLFGYALVNWEGRHDSDQVLLNAILSLGAVYTLLDTYFSYQGKVFLGGYPLAISLMEALFIGLLCYHFNGLDSPFRFYYFLSLICCAIRRSSRVTYATCALHCASYMLLYLARGQGSGRSGDLVLMLIMLAWVTWASSALALLLKRVGDYLGKLNDALRENQSQLEARILERSHELQESQAHVLHQEKMAAFGLLAAGIAHEVGNPLTSISSIVQMLQRRHGDEYTSAKLKLVSGQLQRIQVTLRELINFSRPASQEYAKLNISEIVDEALNIAKYYSGTKGRMITVHVEADLPAIQSVRDRLVQVILNLVLNAVDATPKGGHIDIQVHQINGHLEIAVHDNGSGIRPENCSRLFQPYFTTKKHGTGLGLFVTRKLVNDQGGTVDFASIPGQGTTFRILLPLTPQPNGVATPAEDTIHASA